MYHNKLCLELKFFVGFKTWRKTLSYVLVDVMTNDSTFKLTQIYREYSVNADFFVNWKPYLGHFILVAKYHKKYSSHFPLSNKIKYTIILMKS